MTGREAEELPVLAEFRSDRATYWRMQLLSAAVLGLASGIVLVLMGEVHAWVGPVGAALAIALRGGYLYSEQMATVWRLTPRGLSGPGGRGVALARVAALRRILRDVQIVTDSGDKHLIKYLADPDGVIARIEAARRDARA